MTKRIVRFFRKRKAGVVVLKTLGTVLDLILHILYYGLYPLWWLISKWLVVYAQAIRSEISFRQFVKQATKLWLFSALLLYTTIGVGYMIYLITQGVSAWVMIVKFPLLIVSIIQQIGEDLIDLSAGLVIVCLLLKPARFFYKENYLMGWFTRFIDRF